MEQLSLELYFQEKFYLEDIKENKIFALSKIDLDKELENQFIYKMLRHLKLKFNKIRNDCEYPYQTHLSLEIGISHDMIKNYYIANAIKKEFNN